MICCCLSSFCIFLLIYSVYSSLLDFCFPFCTLINPHKTNSSCTYGSNIYLYIPQPGNMPGHSSNSLVLSQQYVKLPQFVYKTKITRTYAEWYTRGRTYTIHGQKYQFRVAIIRLLCVRCLFSGTVVSLVLAQGCSVWLAFVSALWQRC